MSSPVTIRFTVIFSYIYPNYPYISWRNLNVYLIQFSFANPSDLNLKVTEILSEAADIRHRHVATFNPNHKNKVFAFLTIKDFNARKKQLCYGILSTNTSRL